jgi:phospholipid/cholesterol/gamma-HCH transport system substrate-binding protein
METDKRYFMEGLFIIVFAVAAALFAVWLVKSGHRDDVTYRINFAESVSGLALGDPVKFRGVDVGSVSAMALDPDNPRVVRVDVKLRKDTPVKTDTRASLRLKGITGVVYIELDGGSPAATRLADATPEGRVPEIPYEKSGLTVLVEQLPKVVERLANLEEQATRAVSDVRGVTREIKENPSVLIWGSKDKKEKTEAEPLAKTRSKPESLGPRASTAGGPR